MITIKKNSDGLVEFITTVPVTINEGLEMLSAFRDAIVGAYIHVGMTKQNAIQDMHMVIDNDSNNIIHERFDNVN